MKKLIMKKFLLILLLSVVSCRGVEKNVPIAEHTKIYKPEIDNAVFQWNDLIDTIEIIPLETTEISLIGDLTKGYVDENYIFVFDSRYHSLFQFSKTGQFVKKIGQMGHGPGDFLEMRDFCISNDIIYLLDYGKIHCYDRNTGIYIESWQLINEKDFNPINFVVYDKDHYVLWSSNPDSLNPDDTEYYSMREINKGKIVAKYFKWVYPLTDDPMFYPCGKDSYYMRPVEGEDVIYKLTGDSISAVFAIDFHKFAISSRDIIELKNSRISNAYLKSNFYKHISNVLETQNYIYFTCMGPDANIFQGLINKKTDEIKFGKGDFWNSPSFFYSDGIYLYGFYMPQFIIARKPKNKGNDLNTCFDMVLDNLKDNIKFDDNFVIAKILLK